MFGIGLPEMILILALALIVVGPDKLPDLARSMAKGLMELKKTAEGLKQSLSEEGNPLNDIKPDLEEAAKSFKQNLLDTPPYKRDETSEAAGVYPPDENAAMAYKELMKTTGDTPPAELTPGTLNTTTTAPQEDDIITETKQPVEEDIATESPKKHDDQ